MDHKTIGFIGAGHLAQPLIQHLIDAGYQVYLYNRTASKLEAFRHQAHICQAVSELCQQVQIVISLVADDNALEQLNPDIVSHLPENGIHVSMSTVSPQLIRQLHQDYQAKQRILLSAPIMGRPEAARAKAIHICMAGDASAKKRIEPILRDMGARQIFDYGESPMHANVAKLGINFLLAAAMEAMAEAYHLVESYQLDAEQFYQMITNTLFSCPAYQGYGKLILQQNFDDTQFSVRLGLKDVNLVRQAAAAQQISMPLTETVARHLQQAIEKGWAEKDWSAFTSFAREKA
ncbi:3-hydroxyisobutyrate dehydrogenase-like beta-hydroxyacid dehydrogenase [Thermoflavifilum aggregans]|uniref:3-hydroxyisobutyrate dehydrogenase-like beta-hydroxyacid dehydrogenase n=1 Tax=Thermoflavifilum aggregans TaxID=454188 RepID=A0A2M9CVH2_9BACT|nr:NAD(P)-dependent oxidoreductase [Thermoflavifilum aggregans]PJJ75910.1 3-hydroxyisobutyrate dehydrogenase-like beta-hydroxyacid dehydrogenase [Thermoflavifilum aggregans]